MNPKAKHIQRRPGRLWQKLHQATGPLQEEVYQSTGISITWPILSLEIELTDTKMVEFIIKPPSGV